MLDEIMEACADENRRRLLLKLQEGEGPLELESSADVSVVEFHHNHLPRLEKAGFIDFNEDRQEVSRGKKFEELSLILDAIREWTD